MPQQDDTKKRSIRSFVRRGGRITASQRNAIDSYWQHYGLEFGQQFRLPDGFAALKMEIGIGNGDALITMAGADTDSLYIGVEVHQPGIGRCLNNIHLQGLANVRLVSRDAIEVLQDMIAAESLDRIMLFFPDPWPKKRHYKRRIVNAHFRDLVHGCLKPGAQFHAATDWQNYAEHIAAEFLEDARFQNQGDARGYSPAPGYRPQTRFEQRGRKLGHGVWDLVFTKI